MKKRIMMIAVVVMSGMLLSGCATLLPGLTDPGSGDDTNAQTPLEQLEEKYGRLPEATLIEQRIEIGTDRLVQYEQEKRYERKGGGYQVSGYEKRLNGLNAESEEAYTETPISYPLTARQDFEMQLQLDELYFTRYEFTDGTLDAVVTAGSEEAVLGLSEALSTTAEDMHLKIETDERHVVGIEITYKTEGSRVTITMEMEY